MSRGAKIFIGSVLVLATLLALLTVALLNFDWNRAKPWLSQHVSDATGRSFAIHGNLSLTWHVPDTMELSWRHWIPWPRLNASNVVFGNPAWARNPAMAEVREITFSVNPFPLLDKTISIPLLVLDSPVLALERREVGMTNWDFSRDDGEAKQAQQGAKSTPSSWKLDVHQFALNQAKLHLLDAVKQVDVQVNIDNLKKEKRDHQLRWELDGTFHGEAISGQGRAGSMLSLRRKRAGYPVEGNFRIGKTTISARGAVSEPFKPGILDLHVKVAGASMAHLYPLLDVAFPETGAFSVEGHLVGTPDAAGRNWRFDQFRGRMGESDLSGSLTYQVRAPRPVVKGSITSAFLNFDDLAPLIGADSQENKSRRGSTAIQPANRLLPVEDFHPERWGGVDADIEFVGRKIMRSKQLPVSNLVTRLRLKESELALAPLKFRIAGGDFESSLHMNGKASPVTAEMTMSARHLQLKQLFPGMEGLQSATSEINGNAVLTATGNSIAAMLASANGEVKALVHQGSLNSRLLDRMGMKVGSSIAARFFGDSQVMLNCAANDFLVEKGIMRARTVVIDTDEATIYVNGDIDLAQEKIALEIKPDSKGMRLMSPDSPLYVTGSFVKPKVMEAENGIPAFAQAMKAASSASLDDVLAPVTASLLPLMLAGPGEKSECHSMFKMAGAKLAAERMLATKPKSRTAARITNAASGR
jgi:AsmA family protein